MESFSIETFTSIELDFSSSSFTSQIVLTFDGLTLNRSLLESAVRVLPALYPLPRLGPPHPPRLCAEQGRRLRHDAGFPEADGATGTALVIKVLLGPKLFILGQWLWLSWGSGRFRFQRSSVRIQSSANFNIEHLITVNCVLKKAKKRKKWLRMAHLKNCFL